LAEGEKTHQKEDAYFDKQSNWFYQWTSGPLGTFWSTVAIFVIPVLISALFNIPGKERS
jgi:hypothetical protein